MKLTQVKTENAKLVGSQQALNSIKEQLSVENSRLTTREKEIDGEWRKERERLSNQVNSITAEAEHLRRELQHQREELMVSTDPLSAALLLELSVTSLNHTPLNQQMNNLLYMCACV